MTELQAARADTTEEFLAKAGPELAALCTACGACFNVCPMVDHLGLRGADHEATTDGLRKLARGEAGPQDPVSWVGSCTKSGLCVSDLSPEVGRARRDAARQDRRATRPQ